MLASILSGAALFAFVGCATGAVGLSGYFAVKCFLDLFTKPYGRGV